MLIKKILTPFENNFQNKSYSKLIFPLMEKLKEIDNKKYIGLLYKYLNYPHDKDIRVDTFIALITSKTKLDLIKIFDTKNIDNILDNPTCVELILNCIEPNINIQKTCKILFRKTVLYLQKNDNCKCFNKIIDIISKNKVLQNDILELLRNRLV